MEVGCLRHPGASSIGSQLQDGDRTERLAKPDNPAMSPHVSKKTGTRQTDKQCKVEKLLNAPHKMLLFRTTQINEPYNPKHKESDAWANIKEALTTLIGCSHS